MSSLITAQIPLVPAGDVRTFPPPPSFPAPLPKPPFGSQSMPVGCITPWAPCAPPRFPFGVCPNALPAGHPHSQKPRSRLGTRGGHQLLAMVTPRRAQPPAGCLGEALGGSPGGAGCWWGQERDRVPRGSLPGTPRPEDAAPAPCPALPPYKGLAPTRGRTGVCVSPGTRILGARAAAN